MSLAPSQVGGNSLEVVLVELDRLWSIADEALAKARALPWGPERIDALKAAARLRNEAASDEIETGEFRKDMSLNWGSKRSAWPLRLVSSKKREVRLRRRARRESISNAR